MHAIACGSACTRRVGFPHTKNLSSSSPFSLCIHIQKNNTVCSQIVILSHTKQSWSNRSRNCREVAPKSALLKNACSCTHLDKLKGEKKGGRPSWLIPSIFSFSSALDIPGTLTEDTNTCFGGFEEILLARKEMERLVGYLIVMFRECTDSYDRVSSAISTHLSLFLSKQELARRHHLCSLVVR